MYVLCDGDCLVTFPCAVLYCMSCVVLCCRTRSWRLTLASRTTRRTITCAMSLTILYSACHHGHHNIPQPFFCALSGTLFLRPVCASVFVSFLCASLRYRLSSARFALCPELASSAVLLSGFFGNVLCFAGMSVWILCYVNPHIHDSGSLLLPFADI